MRDELKTVYNYRAVRKAVTTIEYLSALWNICLFGAIGLSSRLAFHP
jgi:hypothetical protein